MPILHSTFCIIIHFFEHIAQMCRVNWVLDSDKHHLILVLLVIISYKYAFFTNNMSWGSSYS